METWSLPFVQSQIEERSRSYICLSEQHTREAGMRWRRPAAIQSSGLSVSMVRVTRRSRVLGVRSGQGWASSLPPVGLVVMAFSSALRMGPFRPGIMRARLSSLGSARLILAMKRDLSLARRSNSSRRVERREEKGVRCWVSGVGGKSLARASRAAAKSHVATRASTGFIASANWASASSRFLASAWRCLSSSSFFLATSSSLAVTFGSGLGSSFFGSGLGGSSFFGSGSGFGGGATGLRRDSISLRTASMAARFSAT